PSLAPVVSPIVGPTGGPTADVTTPSITVPQNTLLYAWAKNETSANAAALDGYVLDAESTSFLSAESGTAGTAGASLGHFGHSAPIGWQPATVAFGPWNGTPAYTGSATTYQPTPVAIPLSAVSPNGLPLTYPIVTPPSHGALSGAAPNLTYTPSANYI